jgi:ABC-type hemin transport system substrate-binding protein
LWHALADGATVLGQGAGLGALRLEAMVGAFALGSLVMIFAMRPRQPEAVVEAAPEVIVTGAPPSPRDAARAESDQQQAIDQTKYL